MLQHVLFCQILTTYTKKTETDQVDEFSAFVRECLCYLTAVTRNQGAVSGLDPSVVKFWKSMLHKVYDILDKVSVLEKQFCVIFGRRHS